MTASPAPAEYPSSDLPVDTVHGPVEPVPGEPEYGLFTQLGAEAFGTFILVFAGVGTALYASVLGAGVLGVALAFGIAVIAGAVTVGHISGGHFNPAVTLGAAIAGRTSWKVVVPYWLAQLVGGALGAAVLFIVTSSLGALQGNERAFFSAVSNGFGENSPIAAQAPGGFGAVGAAVIEIAVTAVFVTVILGATSAKANKNLAPIAIGLTLTALLLVAIPVTNGSINPARSTATAIFSESWALDQLWMFWVAPLIGAAVAGAVGYVLFSPRVTVEEDLDEDWTSEEDAADASDEAAR